MRLILKLIAAPLILFLTIIVAVLLFLFSGSSFLLIAASAIMALLGVGLFFISYPMCGVIYLVIAFLLSPYGLQAVKLFRIPYQCFLSLFDKGNQLSKASFSLLVNRIRMRMPILKIGVIAFCKVYGTSMSMWMESTCIRTVTEYLEKCCLG